MSTATSILTTSARDLLTSLAFSSGQPVQLATSSLDGSIRLHVRTAPDVDWEEIESWKAHEGAVLRVRWGEREWAGVLASAGVEGAVRIWEAAEGLLACLRGIQSLD
jgi:WD40 repeat protein